MNILFIVIILLIIFVSVLMVIAGLPGTFAAAGGIFILSLFNGFEIISLKLMLVFFLAAIFGEVLEFVSGMAGARKYGASTKGTVGAIIGGLIGAIILTAVLPGLGILIGVFAGTFLGAFTGEYLSGKDLISAGKIGWGAFLGRAFAIGVKVLIILSLGAFSIAKYIQS